MLTAKSLASFGLALDNLFERALCAFRCLIGFRLAGGFKEAFGLCRVIRLAFATKKPRALRPGIFISAGCPPVIA
jgi:hypothetical protein